MSSSGYKYKHLVTAVIPARDEELSVGEIVRLCALYASEVLVVDGHSQDTTRQVAEAAGARVILDNDKGKGDAIRTAISHITTPVAVFIDADWSHDPHDIPTLVELIASGNADHVTGSRLIGGSSELHGGFGEFLRLAGSAFITFCINWRFKVLLSDSQNGFRAIRTEVLADLGLTSEITTIEQEMIIKTLRKGYRMMEVPTHEHKRRYGNSHIVLSRVWWRYVLNLAYNLLRR